MIKKILPFAFTSLLTVPALGDTWCHESHTASDQTKIEMHYQVDTYFSRFKGMITYRKNVWLHVDQSSLQGTEQVRWVALNMKRQADGSFVEEPRLLELDASFDAEHRRFSATANNFFMPIHEQFGDDYLQELAVVINGRWLKDSRTGSSNFVFAAQDYPGNCAAPY